MICTTEAIVLYSSISGESDICMQMLTEKSGIIDILAKGLKKSTRRSHLSAEIGVLSQVIYSKKMPDKMAIAKEMNVIDVHSPLRETIRKIMYLNFIIETVRKTTPKNHPDDFIFRMLKAALTQLESTDSTEHLALFFIIHLLRCHGILPQMDACVSCGRNTDTPYHFSIKEKGIICPVCARIPRGDFLAVPYESRRFIGEVLKSKFSGCDLSIVSQESALTLLYYLLLYIETYFNEHIKTKSFIFSDFLLENVHQHV